MTFSRFRRALPWCVALCCSLGFVMLSGAQARAATYTVTTVADNATGTCTANSVSNGCTLRAAITAANATPADADAIVFAGGLAGQTITLDTVLPDLSTSLNISNSAAQTITLARSNTDRSGNATPNFRILRVSSSTAVVGLTGLTITNGNTSGNPGGGILNDGGALSLTNCTISGNTNNVNGGGINTANGTLNMTNCTVANNTILDSNYISTDGGGLSNISSMATLINCTFSGNTARFGGGCYSSNGLTLINCTFSDNTARIRGGGLFVYSTVKLDNCLVAGNTATADANTNDIYDGGGFNVPVGTGITSQGYNLVGKTNSTSFTQMGDTVAITPAQVKLGTLADNGGPTQTLALQQGSIAVDKGNTTLATDQRGVGRPFGSADDVGAYEFNGTASFVVTTPTDEDDGTSDPTSGTGTSLREAITAANLYSNSPKTITFAPGLVGQTITLNSALPALTSSLNISNPAAQTITIARNTAAATNFRILTVGDSTHTGLTVNLSGLTLANGLLGNDIGGGLLNQQSTATLLNCTVRNNTTKQFGGGIENVDGTLTLLNCTVSDNTANSYGGGIDSIDSVDGSTPTTTTLANCTLSGNKLVNGNSPNGNGGGLFIAGTGTLTNCTLSGNSAKVGGGLFIGGTGMLSNSIVVGNPAPTGGDIYNFGKITSQGYNLIGTGNSLSDFTGMGDKTGVTTAQVNLGSLQNNGGPTQTLALQAGSLAINAGNTALTTDQRGVGRPFGGADDVGAYEFQGPFTESLVVTTSTDEDNNTSDPAYGTGTSLREAINYANQNADPSDITFADNIVGQTITLKTALPDVTTSLTILNPITAPAQTITLARSTDAGTPNFPILRVLAPTTTVELSGLTLTNGHSTDTPDDPRGGGLYIGSSTVALTNCVVSNNVSDGVGGGVWSGNGKLTLTNSTVSGNKAQGNAGGLELSAGTLVLTNSTVSDNTANGDGGGLHAGGSKLTVTNSTVSGNSAAGNGGGLYDAASPITLTDSTVSGNTAKGGSGGGLYLYLISGDDSTLTNSTISGNSATSNATNGGSGGGLYTGGITLTLSKCTVASNTSEGAGGGVFSGGSTLTLANCTVAGNSAPTNSGGGFSTNGGTLTLTGSTVSGNTAGNDGGGFFDSGTTLSLTSSTVANNKAARGGGIFNNGGTLALSSCTLTANNASDNNAGGGIAGVGTTNTLSNTIVAGNASTDLDTFTGATFVSKGYNVVGTTGTDALTDFSAANGDQVGISTAQLHLGLLADNGGPTQTIAVLPGSPAFNAGNPDATALPSTDQRGDGFPRVVGGRADVGAYEAQAIAVQGTVYNAVARGGLSGIRLQALTSDTTVAAQTLTDDGGHYSFPIIPGTYTLVAAKPDNANFRFNPAFTNPVTFTDAGTGAGAGTTSYDFRAIGIGGRVISPFNKGIQGVTLTLTAQGAATQTDPQVSDADGFFSFDGLAEGDYTLAPSGSSNLVFTPSSRSLTLADKPLFTSFKASAKITYAIGGRVILNYEGTSLPLQDVTVTATRVSDGQVFPTQTDGDGNYTFSTLTEDRYTVTAQAKGFVFTYAPTPKQSQPLVLTSGSPAKAGINFVGKRLVSGTVYNAVGLKGLRGVVVVAYKSGNQSFATNTDAQGHYSLALEGGSYNLVAFVPHTHVNIYETFSNPVTIRSVEPNGGAFPDSFDFRIVGIGGRVISPTNQGISGVTVNLYTPRDTALKNPLRSVMTDDRGFFSFDGIENGNWNIVPVSPNTSTYTPAARVVTVQDQAVFISFKASVKKGGSGTRSVESGQHSALVLSTASANAQADTLTLKFTGALDAASVAELSHYRVLVNGVEVSVSDATLINGGDTIVLSLPEGTLTHGSKVLLGWSGVLDTLGLPLQGQTQLTVS